VGAANDLSKESTEFEESPTIYYGDPVVNLGQPFSITCIIPITDQIHWLKNGEPITRHNLRHGRDDHAYVLSESAIEGEYCGEGLDSGGVDSTTHLVICCSR